MIGQSQSDKTVLALGRSPSYSPLFLRGDDSRKMLMSCCCLSVCRLRDWRRFFSVASCHFSLTNERALQSACNLTRRERTPCHILPSCLPSPLARARPFNRGFRICRQKLYRPRGKFVDHAPYCENNAATRGEAAATYRKMVHELSSTSVFIFCVSNHPMSSS